mgnify:CR=1 FL=1
MLPEISLNILDISENSVSAKATEIKIVICVNTQQNQLMVQITDNGKGMDAETLNRVTDPFYTTRTTRKVGLGIPFFKQEAECTGGSFSISSVPGKGTQITAVFCTDSIDCMPLGNLNETVYSLIVMHPDIDFYYQYQVNGAEFHLDTKKCGKCLAMCRFQRGGIIFLRDYLEENEADINRMQNYPGNSKEGSYEIIRRIESNS